MGFFTEFRRWIGLKVVATGLILGLVLSAGALWLGLLYQGDYDARQAETIRSINSERAKVQAALIDVHQRMAKLTADIATEEARIEQSDGIITQLKSLDSSWDRLTGDAQQKANSERREKLERQRVESADRVRTWQADYRRTGWERDGLEIELSKLDARLRTAELNQSKARYYLGQAWNHRLGGMKLKGWMILVMGLSFLVQRCSSGREARRSKRVEPDLPSRV